jgi:hypothetical protein
VLDSTTNNRSKDQGTSMVQYACLPGRVLLAGLFSV